jgi:hypothetical protein
MVLVLPEDQRKVYANGVSRQGRNKSNATHALFGWRGGKDLARFLWLDPKRPARIARINQNPWKTTRA